MSVSDKWGDERLDEVTAKIGESFVQRQPTIEKTTGQ
jgi:hypothetical protein